MRLRLKFPVNTTCISESGPIPTPAISFEHNGYQVELTFDGSDDIEDASADEKTLHSRLLSNVILLIDGGPPGSTIDDLVEKNHPEIYVQHLVPILNRTLRAIRNYGVLPHIKEILPRHEYPEELLRRLELECSSIDGSTWTKLYPDKSALWSAIFSAAMNETKPLRAARLTLIEEAIQDNQDSGPERELLTNAVGHLSDHNYRLALLDAVICLEIALSDWLTHYLSVNRGLSKSRIERLVNSQLGLTTRVGLILELALYGDEKKEANLDKVLTAVRWRNEIVHKKGRLPEEIPDDRLEDGIWAVLGLAQDLGFKRDLLASTPEAKELIAKFSEKLGVRFDEWTFFPLSHRVTIAIHTGFRNEEMPDEQILHIVSELAEACKSRDQRFDRNSHLSIKFSKGLMNTFAVWTRGKLEKLETSPKHGLAVRPPGA